MSRRNRRLSRELNEMPGLFDTVEAESSFVVAESRPPRSRRPDTAAPSMALDPAAVQRPATLRFLSMGSGSSGNCTYIGTQQCGVLVDAGVDPDKVMAALKSNGIDPRTIGGIVLTHDHADHVRFAYQILRGNRHMRLYATPRVLTGLLRRHSISRRIKDYHTAIYKEFEFRVGPLSIVAFDTSHDGSDNMGFAITLTDMAGEAPIMVIATDMGEITERADHYMRLATHLMIESNYDEHMLRTGPYQEYLKARIASAKGHMDNAVTAAYLAQIWTPQLHRIFLCHLSNDNNRPDLAIKATTDALTAAGVEVGDGSDAIGMRERPVQLIALPRYEATDLIALL